MKYLFTDQASEWNVLVNHFGPTTPITCDSTEGAIKYTPGLCGECVMLHDLYIDQVIGRCFTVQLT